MNLLKQYMHDNNLSSSKLAEKIAADGIKGIGAVTIRQWMCEGHRPYRTAIDKLREFEHWRDLADILECMADSYLMWEDGMIKDWKCETCFFENKIIKNNPCDACIDASHWIIWTAVLPCDSCKTLAEPVKNPTCSGCRRGSNYQPKAIDDQRRP